MTAADNLSHSTNDCVTATAQFMFYYCVLPPHWERNPFWISESKVRLEGSVHRRGRDDTLIEKWCR